jgi:predicted esterase
VADAHTIPTATHGRYLVQQGGVAAAALVMGFHGYAEDADAQLERLRSIPGSDLCVLVSVQGLHRFYRGRSQDVVASWMTRQDRHLLIADNLAYVAAVMASVRASGAVGEPVGQPVGEPVVFAGFSQGVAMAYRAACATAPLRPSAVIALGGELPPELDPALLSHLRHVLIGRGERDQYYLSEMADRDAARLAEADVPVARARLDAAHEWTAEFSRAAGELISVFLKQCDDGHRLSNR